MEYGVKELSRLAGVTARTLRWYDAQGLLKPLRVTEAGYRVYGEAQVDTLQHILFYRALGFELGVIREILSAPEFRRGVALQSHLAALEERRTRLDALILTVKKTIAAEKGDIEMSSQEKFKGFKQEALMANERKYGAEIREKYGEETVRESNEKFAGLSKEEYNAMNSLGERILTALETAVRDGADPAGKAGRKIAALHREWLGYTWHNYSVEAHRGLGQMYVDDERFAAYYDKNVNGCAQFLRDAILAQTSE